MSYYYTCTSNQTSIHIIIYWRNDWYTCMYKSFHRGLFVISYFSTDPIYRELLTPLHLIIINILLHIWTHLSFIKDCPLRLYSLYSITWRWRLLIYFCSSDRQTNRQTVEFVCLCWYRLLIWWLMIYRVVSKLSLKFLKP